MRAAPAALAAVFAFLVAVPALTEPVMAASISTVNAWTIRGGVDTGVTQFEVTEVFTPAADLGGSDNRYTYTIRNLTPDLFMEGFRVANPANLPRNFSSPAGWTPRSGAQNFFWDGGPLPPGATESGFVVLTPGLLPELTAAGGFDVAAGEAGFIVTDASGVRVDVFGPLSHLGTVLTVPIAVPGVDVVSTSTTERSSSSTSIPNLQVRSVSPVLGNVTVRTTQWRQQRGIRGPSTTVTGSLGAAGLAAGETELGIRTWGNIEGRSFSDSFPSTAFDADSSVFTLGADALIGERALIGALASYDDQDIDTRFNAGSQDIAQVQAALYGSWLFGDRYSVDGALGYGHLDIEQERRQAGQGVVSSSLTGRRWFGSLNLNAFWDVGEFLVDVSTGVLYARDRLSSFAESNGLINPGQIAYLGQWRLGAQVTLPFRQRMLPGDLFLYVSGFHVHDFKRTKTVVGPNQLTPPEDDTEFEFRTGVRYETGDTTSASLEYVTVIGRSRFESDILSGTLSISF